MDTNSAAAPTQSKAEIRLAEQAAKREQKARFKEATKIANAEKRANGVIGTLHQMLMVESGATKKEVLAALTAKFPDRDPIGMATTVGIQLSRLQKKHGRIVSRKQGERGLVYGYEKSVKYSAETSEGSSGTGKVTLGLPAADPVVHVDAHADGYAAQHASGKVTEHRAPVKGAKGGSKKR